MDILSVDMGRTFGAAFRAAMASAKLDTKALASRSGVKASTISKLRSTAHIPRPETLDQLLPTLGLEMDELLVDVITPWGMTLTPNRGDPVPGKRPVKRRRAG